MASKLEPLDVERETRPGKYLTVTVYTSSSRALVDLEQEAPQSMAVFAQAIRLPQDRKTHCPGHQAETHLRIAPVNLG